MEVDEDLCRWWWGEKSPSTSFTWNEMLSFLCPKMCSDRIACHRHDSNKRSTFGQATFPFRFSSSALKGKWQMNGAKKKTLFSRCDSGIGLNDMTYMTLCKKYILESVSILWWMCRIITRAHWQRQKSFGPLEWTLYETNSHYNNGAHVSATSKLHKSRHYQTALTYREWVGVEKWPNTITGDSKWSDHRVSH